jgi:peptide chain release factor 1
LAAALARADEVERALANPAGLRDAKEFAELGREHRRLTPVVEMAARLEKAENELVQARELVSIDDPEMAAEARAEVARLEAAIADLEAKLLPALIPRDPLDDRNAIVEIRAGTGGDEAALFAADLYRMYSRYLERHGMRIELMSMSDAPLGGIKEVVFKVSGDSPFGNLRWESGVHRVQRVPATEAQGRIHTSAATVAVLPEAEDVDVRIEDKDLRIDVFRSSGPGGQSVNTTDSAVRITIRNRSCRTSSRRWKCCARGSSTCGSPNRRRSARACGARRSAPATVRPRFARTTTRRAASPIIASGGRRTTSRASWTATSSR